MKKLNYFLNTVLILSFLYFIIRTIYNFWEYKTKPELYMVVSAPWYCIGALNSFIVFLLVTIIFIGLKIIIKKANNKKIK